MAVIDVDAQIAWLEGQVGFRAGGVAGGRTSPYMEWITGGATNWGAYCDALAQQGAVEAGGFRWPEHCQYGSRGDAYCPWTEQHGRELDIWRAAGWTPYRGVQVLFDWTGWGGADHIETVWGTDDGWKTFWTVGGNTGSPNGVHWVRRDWTYVRGFVDLPASGPGGSRLLIRGSQGSDVATLQQRLIALGYDLGEWGADGDFGDATERAVRQFQSDRHLEIDGEVGEATWAALGEDPPKPEPTALLPSGQGEEMLLSLWGSRAYDVLNGSMDAGAHVIIHAAHGATNQRWQLHPVGDGKFAVSNVKSGLVWESDGGAVTQAAFNGKPTQHFVWEEIATSVYRVRHVASGKVVGPSTADTPEDAHVVLADQAGGPEQAVVGIWADPFWVYRP